MHTLYSFSLLIYSYLFPVPKKKKKKRHNTQVLKSLSNEKIKYIIQNPHLVNKFSLPFIPSFYLNMMTHTIFLSPFSGADTF